MPAQPLRPISPIQAQGVRVCYTLKRRAGNAAQPQLQVHHHHHSHASTTHVRTLSLMPSRPPPNLPRRSLFRSMPSLAVSLKKTTSKAFQHTHTHHLVFRNKQDVRHSAQQGYRTPPFIHSQIPSMPHSYFYLSILPLIRGMAALATSHPTQHPRPVPQYFDFQLAPRFSSVVLGQAAPPGR